MRSFRGWGGRLGLGLATCLLCGCTGSSTNEPAAGVISGAVWELGGTWATPRAGAPDMLEIRLLPEPIDGCVYRESPREVLLVVPAEPGEVHFDPARPGGASIFIVTEGDGGHITTDGMAVIDEVSDTHVAGSVFVRGEWLADGLESHVSGGFSAAICDP